MTMLQDVRYGARALARTKGFSVTAVLTLAVGIGGNTAVFSLVDAVILRPLPYHDPDRLVALSERRADGTHPISGHEFAAWRDRTTVFEAIAAYLYVSFTATGAGDAEPLDARLVSAGYFDVLGIAPRLGRTFRAGEDRAGSNRVAVLSHRLWQRRYGGAPTVIGRSIVLDGVPHEIVGVMDPRGDLDPDIWVPVDLPQELRRVGRHSTFAIARLAAGVTLERARSDLDVIARQVEREFPDASTGHRVALVPLHEELVGSLKRPAWVALGAVAFVLLIACVNVTHLLLTRTASRQREIAVRVALGAARGALIRQLLVESVLLALFGGSAGLLVSVWIIDLLPALVRDVPRLSGMRIDVRVLTATGLISLVAGLAAGLAPALRGTRRDLRTRMQAGPQATTAAPTATAGVLVASEIALALVLLVGSGLMIRSFVRLTRVDPGFEPAGVCSSSRCRSPACATPRRSSASRRLMQSSSGSAGCRASVPSGRRASCRSRPVRTGRRSPSRDGRRRRPDRRHAYSSEPWQRSTSRRWAYRCARAASSVPWTRAWRCRSSAGFRNSRLPPGTTSPRRHPSPSSTKPRHAGSGRARRLSAGASGSCGATPSRSSGWSATCATLRWGRRPGRRSFSPTRRSRRARCRWWCGPTAIP